MAVSRIYFDSYLTKYKEYYKKYFTDIEKAYNCTVSNPSTKLSSALVKIKDSVLKPLTNFGDWDDNVEEEFVENISVCNTQLTKLIDNVETTFVDIEKNYKSFYEELKLLKTNFESLATHIGKYPNESDYKKIITNTRTGSRREELNTEGFNKAVDIWQNTGNGILSKCDNNITNCETYLANLKSLDKTSFATVNKVGAVNVLKAFDTGDVLGLDQTSLNNLVNFCFTYGISQRGSREYNSQCSQLARSMGYILSFGADINTSRGRVVNSRTANDDNISRLLCSPGGGYKYYTCDFYPTREQAYNVIQEALSQGVYPTMSVWNASANKPGSRHEVTVVKIQDGDIYVWDPANNNIKKAVVVENWQDCPSTKDPDYNPDIRYWTALNFKEGRGFQVSLPNNRAYSRATVGGTSAYTQS